MQSNPGASPECAKEWLTEDEALALIRVHQKLPPALARAVLTEMIRYKMVTLRTVDGGRDPFYGPVGGRLSVTEYNREDIVFFLDRRSETPSVPEQRVGAGSVETRKPGVEATKKGTGPRAEKGPAARNAMKADIEAGRRTLAELMEMKQEVLLEEYGKPFEIASRETVCKARDVVSKELSRLTDNK